MFCIFIFSNNRYSKLEATFYCFYKVLEFKCKVGQEFSWFLRLSVEIPIGFI